SMQGRYQTCIQHTTSMAKNPNLVRTTNPGNCRTQPPCKTVPGQAVLSVEEAKDKQRLPPIVDPNFRTVI
ncbi:hypothetical protein, partial [Acidithiobacillus thiooxidans]|uniref:hypothetical protein n=1 Tax=Acidithiobacillus thiooxidans TaxID=930 RepID=UPI001C31BB38